MKQVMFKKGGNFVPLPEGMVFMNRLQFGFYSVLARLDVEVDYAAVERAFMADIAPEATARRDTRGQPVPCRDGSHSYPESSLVAGTGSLNNRALPRAAPMPEYGTGSIPSSASKDPRLHEVRLLRRSDPRIRDYQPAHAGQMDQLRWHARLRWLRRPHGRAPLVQGRSGAEPHHQVHPAAAGVPVQRADPVPAQALELGNAALLAAVRAHARCLRPLRVPRGSRLQSLPDRVPRHQERDQRLRPDG